MELRDGFLSAVPHPRTGCFSRCIKHLKFLGRAADQPVAYAGAEILLQGWEHEVASQQHLTACHTQAILVHAEQ